MEDSYQVPPKRDNSLAMASHGNGVVSYNTEVKHEG